MREAVSGMKPNIIVIMSDQQRWDTLGVAGNPVIRTPTLDRLARSGVWCPFTFVQNPLCTPSRASILTGMYTHAHGVRTVCEDEIFGLPPWYANLAGVLKAEGYLTGLCGKDHLFFEPMVRQHFDHVVEYNHRGRVTAVGAKSVERAIWEFRGKITQEKYTSVEPFPAASCPTARITTEAIEFLRAAAGKPFFLWLSYPDPHPPFVVAEPYASMYDPAAIPPGRSLPGEFDTKPLRQRVAREIMRMDTYTAEDLACAKAIYYGMITFIDDELARFLEALENLGLAKQTVVAFISDHGDYMGDHGMIRKSPALYDCLVRVPFILWGPEFLEPRVVGDDLVESIDLMPTLLDLAGVPVPPGVQGKSLMPFLRGRQPVHKDQAAATNGTEWRAFAADDLREVDFAKFRDRPYVHAAINPLVMRGRFAMIRTRNWKLVHYLDEPGELYSLSEDPGELVNLYGRPAHTDRVRDLEGRLLAWMIESATILPPMPEGILRMLEHVRAKPGA